MLVKATTRGGSFEKSKRTKAFNGGLARRDLAFRSSSVFVIEKPLIVATVSYYPIASVGWLASVVARIAVVVDVANVGDLVLIRSVPSHDAFVGFLVLWIVMM